MNPHIDYTPITNSKRYAEDQPHLSTTGNQQALRIVLLIAALMIPILWPVVIFYAYNYYQQNKHKTEERMRLLHEFANKHGFAFTQHHKGFVSTASQQIAVDVPYLYKTNSPWYEMRGNIENYPFMYAMVSLTGGDDKKGLSSPMTNGTFTVLTIDLPLTLPRMFIDSKVNNLGVLDGKALNFNQSEDHALEGDFHQYFNVRIEKSEHIDMYTILTPEVMDKLKQHNYFDVWLNGNKLTLIAFANQERYFVGLPTMFETSIMLTREIDKIARVIRQSQYSQAQ